MNRSAGAIALRPHNTSIRTLGARLGVGVFLVAVLAWLAASPSLAATGEAALVLDDGRLTLGWAAVLGALQGATEFLPVSSSGHLSLAQALLGVDATQVGHRFTITVHAGTLLAVVWVYRREVRDLLRAALTPHVASQDRIRIVRMFIASLPLGVVLLPGVEPMIIAMESSPRAIGFALWATALFLFVGFRGQAGMPSTPSTEPPSTRQAVLIGLAQLLAVLPGISRSGTTIAMGIRVGLDRASAARFSFLISLLAVGAATLKEAIAMFREPAGVDLDLVPFAVGFATALCVGLLSLRGLLYLVGKGRVLPFVVYLAAMGALAVTWG